MDLLFYLILLPHYGTKRSPLGLFVLSFLFYSIVAVVVSFVVQSFFFSLNFALLQAFHSLLYIHCPLHTQTQLITSPLLLYVWY